jgi:zinc protease
MLRIRQKEGLSYGVGPSFRRLARPRRLVVRLRDRRAPEHRQGRGFVQGRARARDPRRVHRCRSRRGEIGLPAEARPDAAQDGALAGGWVSYLFLGRTYEFSKQLEERVKALKPADLAAALRKHIDPAKISFVKAGRFRESEMRILVTGAAGFIGFHLARRLLERGDEVVGSTTSTTITTSR